MQGVLIRWESMGRGDGTLVSKLYILILSVLTSLFPVKGFLYLHSLLTLDTQKAICKEALGTHGHTQM